MIPSPVAERLWNPNSLEINAVEHCNLSCAGCSHLSPLMRKRNIDPEDVARSLSKLAQVYSAARVKVVGGEPLLHPDLPRLLRVIRDSRIARSVDLCTNGVLLWKMDPKIWTLIDRLEVSLYPGTATARFDLEPLRRRALDHGVALDINAYRSFRASYCEDDDLTPYLAQRVFSSCQIAHHWRCHTLHDGHFFLCPQSLFLPRRLADGDGWKRDGVDVHAPGLHDRLAALLRRHEPLEACSRCLGTVGKSFPHHQAKRRNWAEDQSGRAEDRLDFRRLTELEGDITLDESGDCVAVIEDRR
jgi:hypothetical protein